LSLTLAKPSFWQGAPQLEPDVRRTSGVEAFQQAYVKHGITSVVAVPVLVFGEVRAGLVIRAVDPGYFSAAMIDLLQQAAASIGLGLESHEQRTRLLQSVRDEARQRRMLRLLSEMIKVVTHSADEQVLLANACDVSRSVGGYLFAGIALLELDSPQTLLLRAHDGLAGQCESPLRCVLDSPDLGQHAVVGAMRTGRPQISQVLPLANAGWPLRAEMPDLGAVLTMPLRLDGIIIGVFVVGAVEAGAFEPAEVQIFTEMATELGLGIQIQRAKAARRVAERDLRFNLQYFRSIFSNQHVGMLVLSEDETVKYVNEAFCELHGLLESPAELEGRPAALIFSQLAQIYEQPQAEIRRLGEILSGGDAVKGEEVSIRGGRTFLRDFTPISIDGLARGRIWQEREITDQKRQEQSVKRLAFYDVVTGLPNRRLLFELLEQARKQALREQTLLAVGVLDLDRFKSVNDTIGHEGGDQALMEASARIRAMLRKADVLARFGGDEFALIIPGLDSREQLDAISRCILQALRAPFILMGEQVHLSASIGWTLFPLDPSAAEGLVRHADLAMYAAKEDGKDRGVIYEPAMENGQIQLQAMRDRFVEALANSQLRLLYQPIVYIDGLPGRHGVAGMEALLRLDDSDEGLIEPARFMHVLDDAQLARPIGRFVLGEALKQCQAWMMTGVWLPVSVNISTRHLLHPAFFSDIDAVLETYPGVLDVGFGIEVTETGPTMDHARAKIVIEECRRRGIRVSLDDFGTGSASLSHIQQLDIEHIKLDQSFVRDILSDERNVAIAAGVITTARMLAKAVIAEGVETSAQGDLLASLGCHQLQGYSISRPMLAESVAGWVSRWVPPDSWEHMASERQSLLSAQSWIQ
jgi:diguanylate cyclase (GGDEF)-like protein/PAS domain S-box-containing protein